MPKVAGNYEGKFDIEYSRAHMTEKDHSSSIGAGDVGNPYETDDDASAGSYPCVAVPERKDNPVKRRKGE